jgi:hypothetical protein
MGGKASSIAGGYETENKEAWPMLRPTSYTTHLLSKGRKMETRRTARLVAGACILAAGLSAGATARIIYVDDDARPEDANGSSWASTCRTP